jgi:hypothetical protein
VNQPAANRQGFQSFPNGRPGNPTSGAANNGPNQQTSHDGFHPFAPPAASTNAAANDNVNRNGANRTANNQNDRSTTPGQTNTAVSNNQANRNEQTTPGDQRQPMRFTPPVKARDQDYDVHPPLNQQNPSQARPEQKPQEKPQQHQEKENKKEDDKKDKK